MKPKILLIGANSLVGRSIAASMENDFQIIPTAGHHEPEDGYQLAVEETDKLVEILSHENPEIVVSSIRGDFHAQMEFHRILANWLAGKKKRLLYISTANVFDGSLSKPWTENDFPTPESDYGKFKYECETMLTEILGSQLIIFRLAAVWSADCPRVRQLESHSRNGELHNTYPDYMINVTLAKQIGEYAKYVLEHNLHGIFHVGSTDMVNYTAFEKMVCEALKIKQPQFIEETAAGKVFLAILPAREEIPDSLQLTVADVLSALR